jgi:hypothetical protein
MKTLIFGLFLTCLFLTSCTTQRRCQLKFPTQISNETIHKDSIHTEIIYKDKLVPYEVKGKVEHDSVFVSIPCPDPPKKGYIPDTARVETEFAIAKAWLDWPKIKIDLTQKGTILYFNLQNAITEKNTFKMLYEKEKSKEIVTIKETPKFWKVTGWIGMGSILALIAFLFVKFKRLI